MEVEIVERNAFTSVGKNELFRLEMMRKRKNQPILARSKRKWRCRTNQRISRIRNN